MSYTYEKQTGDLVIGGWEKGIATSPHKGIANMQAVNISTESGEVMCNFSRVAQQQLATTGTLTISGDDTLSASGATEELKIGNWLTMTSAGITQLTNGVSYYIVYASGNTIRLSTAYSNSWADDAIGGLTYSGGPPSFTTGNYLMSKPIDYALETYSDSVGVQYRYYILDSAGQIWVSDTAASSVVLPTDKPDWYLPTKTRTVATGIAVLNGWLFNFNSTGFVISCKQTVNLAAAFATFYGGSSMTNLKHFAFVGHQGKLYYTDGNYIGSIFPNSSLVSGVANIQSFFRYSAVTTTGTIAQVISGSRPTTGEVGSTTRIPVQPFATGTGAAVPTALTTGVTYYALMITTTTFEIYAAATGGAAINIETGTVGTQYFNTFYPSTASGMNTITFTPQRLNLPTFETSQTIAEIGNNLLIGCADNIVYPWNQVDPIPGDLIFLPEGNVSSIVTVNNMGYIFTGSKGNIYITNGSAASAVISVPDYCAGIAGTPASYIEPYFTWGGTMYLRGRVYFSVVDQTAAKTGNCGGIWSFIPTQNVFFGDADGIVLRLENESSYVTYNGLSNILFAEQDQAAISPQYWSGWQSSYAGSPYGLDFTGTTTLATMPAVIETDLIPTGTMLDKKTFKQIEYKLSTPLAVGESVAISYRQNSTDAYVSCGTAVVESTTSLSGYFTVNFEKGQWLQLKITLTPLSTSASTFCRLVQVRVR